MASTKWKRLVSPEVAAEALDLSAKTVRRRIADNSIPAYRVGRLVKVDIREAAQALLKPMNDAARRSVPVVLTAISGDADD